MTSAFTKCLMMCTLLFTTSLSAFAADTFKLDPEHSYVLWHIDHFGFSSPSGKWFVQGSLTLDKDKPQHDKVDITIDIASLDTGLKELDDHLKGKLFFDSAQYPKATFVSTKVTPTGKKSAKVEGLLTVHGVSKPVTLNVKLNKVGDNPITNKMTAGFSATTTIKRSDFGIKTLLPGIGDEVVLTIEAEAYKVS